MSYTVETKFVGPTSERGARIRARMTDYDGKVVTMWSHWEYEDSSVQNHRAAARSLVNKVRAGHGSDSSDDDCLVVRIYDHPVDKACMIGIVDIDSEG